MTLLDHTFVISRDPRPDKWAQVCRHLSAIGVPNPVCVNAVNASADAVKTSLSHLLCLERAKSQNLPHVFVCDEHFRCVDHVRFRNSFSKFETENGESTPGRVGRWDVLLLGGNNTPPYTTVPGVDYCVCVENCRTAVGYIVLAHAYDAVIQNIREGVGQLIQSLSPCIGPGSSTGKQGEFEMDVYWTRLQARGTWYLLTPLTIITGVVCSGETTDDLSRHHGRSMLDLDKYWLLSPMYADRERKKIDTN